MELQAKNATPGMLTGESIWDNWEAQLTHHICILYGAYGVLLVYIIQEDEDLPVDAKYNNFNAMCFHAFCGSFTSCKRDHDDKYLRFPSAITITCVFIICICFALVN